MSNKYIAVKGCTVVFSGLGTAASIAIATPPSDKVKVDGNGIYSGPITVNIIGYSSPTTGGTTGNGSGVINPTAESVDSDGNKVIRVGDQSVPITIMTVTGSPLDVVTATIIDAGQKKIKAA